jgi:uncharacterized protein (TIGR00290 family)
MKTFFNWSTGKDSALALYHMKRDPLYQIGHLLTSVNATFDRVSMHGLRRELLERQVRALGIPATTVEMPESPDMTTYEQLMSTAVTQLKNDGFTCAAFGDIFLEDLRIYRETKLAELGIEAAFPLWKRNTADLVREFIDLGFRAVVVCVDARHLDGSFAGRELDHAFLGDLPPGVDPCGENGEFHTFCFAGPIFSENIDFDLGEKVHRTYTSPNNKDDICAPSDAGFWYCDLLPR